MRRSGARQPLHDPEAENALVLYAPPEISEHDIMATRRWPARTRPTGAKTKTDGGRSRERARSRFATAPREVRCCA